MPKRIQYPKDTKEAAAKAGNTLLAFGYDGPAGWMELHAQLPDNVASKLLLFVQAVFHKKLKADDIPSMKKL